MDFLLTFRGQILWVPRRYPNLLSTAFIQPHPCKSNAHVCVIMFNAGLAYGYVPRCAYPLPSIKPIEFFLP